MIFVNYLVLMVSLLRVISDFSKLQAKALFGRTMEGFAHSNEFCPNETCPDYGKIQKDQSKPNLKKIGFTRGEVQRYQCKTCNGTFTETRGTIFYRKCTSEHQILETLALLAEGNRISNLAHAKGSKEDTILDWLREAAAHIEQVKAVLMRDFKVKRELLDVLWAHVGRKKASLEDEEGEVWQATLADMNNHLRAARGTGPMKPRPTSQFSRP